MVTAAGDSTQEKVARGVKLRATLYLEVVEVVRHLRVTLAVVAEHLRLPAGVRLCDERVRTEVQQYKHREKYR